MKNKCVSCKYYSATGTYDLVAHKCLYNPGGITTKPDSFCHFWEENKDHVPDTNVEDALHVNEKEIINLKEIVSKLQKERESFRVALDDSERAKKELQVQALNDAETDLAYEGMGICNAEETIDQNKDSESEADEGTTDNTTED